MFYYDYSFQLLGNSFQYNILGGARVIVGAAGEKDEAKLGRGWHKMQAGGRFPLVSIYIYIYISI